MLTNWLTPIYRSTLVLGLFALAAGCGGTPEPPLSNLTSLMCPTPGALPFRLQSYSFAASADDKIEMTEPRNKDEASDTLGVSGGVQAQIFIADADAPAAGSVDYRGVKARTAANQGIFADPFTDEAVSLWSYDSGAWKALGRMNTDGNGGYDFSATGFTAALGQPVYSVLEGDGSCAAHYNYLLPAGTKIVVFDIDGTLTTSDDELLMQVSDGSYTPAMMTAANTMVQEWAQKGYTTVYLTARTHIFRPETRAWLEQLGFPNGPIITTNGTNDAQAYKTLWLKRMITDFGWQAVAAYGNATTDIGAYAAVGIPTNVTFIIGPNGGMGGTVAIANNDYTSNISGFVDGMPNAN